MQKPDAARGLETMSRQIAASNNYYRWIFETIRPWLGRRVLEVGPGYGNIARLVATEGRAYVGVDLDAGVIERLEDELADVAGVELLAADVCAPEVERSLGARGFDTVVSFNVMEHLEDPRRLMASLARIAPGAALVLFVPAMPLLYGTLDREAGHFRRYTKRAVEELLAGLAEPRELRYFNGLGALAWFVAGRVLRLELNSEATNRSISLYDRLVIPLTRATDPLATRWLGQSLLCHARFTAPAATP